MELLRKETLTLRGLQEGWSTGHVLYKVLIDEDLDHVNKMIITSRARKALIQLLDLEESIEVEATQTGFKSESIKADFYFFEGDLIGFAPENGKAFYHLEMMSMLNIDEMYRWCKDKKIALLKKKEKELHDQMSKIKLAIEVLSNMPDFFKEFEKNGLKTIVDASI